MTLRAVTRAAWLVAAVLFAAAVAQAVPASAWSKIFGWESVA